MLVVKQNKLYSLSATTRPNRSRYGRLGPLERVRESGRRLAVLLGVTCGRFARLRRCTCTATVLLDGGPRPLSVATDNPFMSNTSTVGETRVRGPVSSSTTSQSRDASAVPSLRTRDRLFSVRALPSAHTPPCAPRLNPIFIVQIGLTTTPNDQQGRSSRGYSGDAVLTDVEASVRSRTTQERPRW